ncbi:hypothetical protein LN042_20355 [Kitasatospora sp. RB6PN24]|uniref:hypothetical protein n=1 Tax=Kitasatospora humi TaxID=2893891 RepID=UPI001E3DE31D|nr:hypothetical protein [Kitasatospora humi]MCC9309405.1 hypothetical protein [Kitasatospora humi]
MRASVINRIAKIATPAARRADTAWVRRLAATVPLAAVVAVGVAGCNGPQSGGSTPAAAAKAATPSAATPSAAIPGAGVAVTPTAAATPTAPSTSAAPADPASQVAPAAPADNGGAGTPAAPRGTADQPKAPAAPAPQSKAPAVAPGAPAGGTSGDPVAVQFDGLPEGGKLTAGGDQVDFSVTFTNVSGHRLDGVAPVTTAQPFGGARCRMIASALEGTMQRKDGNGWTDTPIAEGTGMDYALSGNGAAFPLAPNESRTVQYRIKLGADNGPAPLVLDAEAFVPSNTSFVRLGKGLRHLAVVDPHRPTASMPSMTPIPTKVTAGGPAVEVEVSPGNFTNAPFASLAPQLTLGVTQENAYTFEGLNPEDVTAEVFTGGAWKKLPVSQDCGKVTVGTSSLAAALQNGPDGHVVNYLFRFSVAKNLPSDITSLDVSAGAVGDGHYAAPVTVPVTVVR